MTTMTFVMLVAGLALLLAGAELLVRGASRLALSLGISPLVIGLTVVAYGTSAPELAISIGATLDGQPDIALGNVIGSNIANVLLILGLSALITPLVVARQLVWLDVPIMVGVSLLVLVLALDGQLDRWVGAALLLGGVAYTVLQVYMGRREGASETTGVPGADAAPSPLWRNAVLVVVGLVLLVLGARWLVASAVTVAEAFGISQLVIGLTVVAIGTSLPEFATSLMAALRGEREMAVGNIIGSNIFNLLLVLGAAVAMSPGGIAVSAAAVNFDLPVMTAVAVACLPIFFTGHCIARWEGALFLGYYVAYTAYLLLNASGHDALPAFSRVMVLFVVPLTVVTLLVVTIRAVRARREMAKAR
jgi:cation:H+ antiporter